MARVNWVKAVAQRWGGWRFYLPGLLVVGLVCGLREGGRLQRLELWALDFVLRSRPAEALDDRVVIVAIEESDFQRYGNSIPDRVLADMLHSLALYQPRAVGVDLIRDLAVEPGYDEWVAALAAYPQVFGIEGIIEPAVVPPPTLPPERVGFADIPVDADGFMRRLLLASVKADQTHISLALRLATAYLEAETIPVQHTSPEGLEVRLGSQTLPRFQSNSGAYIGGAAGGYQILFNPRSGADPFRRISLQEVLTGQFDPAWIRDRVVLVGIIAPSIKDIQPLASVVTDDIPGLAYGVEIQAHATSQLLSMALDGRPAIVGWADPLEYGWIVLWGGLGLGLVAKVARPSRFLITTSLLMLALSLGSFGVLWLWGWWIPVVPPLLVFGTISLYGLGLTTSVYEKTLQARLEERQQVINAAFNTIHNGPIQELSYTNRLLNSGVNLSHIAPRLRDLELSLRDLKTRLAEEIPDEQIGEYQTLQEALYEVYSQTLQRDFPGFQSLKVKSVAFDPMADEGLSPRDRHQIGQFLEEALCNVGKHAIAPTRLTVICQSRDRTNHIRVEDNGHSPRAAGSAPQTYSPPISGGWGTQQSRQLAQRLGGRFDRGPLSPRGTYCELVWPLQPQTSQASDHGTLRQWINSYVTKCKKLGRP